MYLATCPIYCEMRFDGGHMILPKNERCDIKDPGTYFIKYIATLLVEILSKQYKSAKY